MKNKYTFNYPIQTVYEVIAELVVDNANVHCDNKYTLETIAEIDYTYDITTKKGPLKNQVTVMEVEHNQRIVYTITREKFESYLVVFDLNTLENNETELHYEYNVVTEKSRVSLNHKIISILYRGEQKRKFKAMCEYIENKCEEKM